MIIEKAFLKDPDAILDYSWDWADWLDGDTIDTSIFLLPTDLIEVSKSNDNTTTTIFISGGVIDQDYLVTNRITTTGNKTEDRTIKLLCRPR